MVLFFNFSHLQEWYLLKAEEYGYQITFPTEPVLQQRVVDSEVGKLKLNMHLLDQTKSDKINGQVYISGHTAYPEGTVHSDKKEILDDFFKGAIEGNVKNVNGSLMSEKVIEKDGFPGREIIISLMGDNVRIKARSYLVGNVMYTTQVLFFTKNNTNPKKDKFLDSFELLK